MNRLAAYVFWEKDGIVRDYVKYYLNGLKEVCSKIYVVVNGEIQKEGKASLEEEIGAVVLQRPNEGVDFWAYKTALDYEGDGISAYDEVVLCNCSCYGPVYPFHEMFDEMGERQLDFWGITEWPLNEGGYHGTWVLSYFMVFRPRMFLSKEWKAYWRDLTPVASREECIEKHETKFTQYFADRGFSYDVFCHNYPSCMDITIEAPDELVMTQRCPLIKRKAFCCDYERFMPFHRGNRSRRLFDFLRKTNQYSNDIILDDLLATQHMANLYNCLQLDYILPDKTETGDDTNGGNGIAVCLFLSNGSFLDEMLQYLKSMPNEAACFIAAPPTLLEMIREKAKEKGISGYELRPIERLGGMIEALHMFWDDLSKYEIVCAAHDLGDEPAWNYVNREILLFSLDNTLGTAPYVRNIISTFRKETRIGVFMPVNALHASYHLRYGNEWGLNYPQTKQLLENYQIDVPISPNVPPVAPLEGIFWFRTSCLGKLFSRDFDQDGFTEDNCDGSLYHAILRAIPYFAQDMGYLSARILPIREAQGHLINLTEFYIRARCAVMPGERDNNVIDRRLKRLVKSCLPDGVVAWLKSRIRQ